MAPLAPLEAGKLFCDFVNETGSPYHTVAASAKLLKSQGFQELRDGSAWSIAAGGKYFVTKDGADVMAFVVGGKFSPEGNSGFSMVGAHTDSPCLRLRPASKMSSAGMLQIGIQTYGGGLWHTWFDRPLGFAGKVVTRRADGGLAERLVRVPKGVLILPNLAIHLSSADERKAFAVNPESHLQPIICSKKFDDEVSGGREDAKEGIAAKHHAVLLDLIAKELEISPGDIVDADLCLMDAQPSNIAGCYDEFISSGRIDNVLSTWAAVHGISAFAGDAARVAESQDVCVAVAFDHEECGSQSAVGADGYTLPGWCERILTGLNVQPAARPTVYARSFLVSADCAHGVHPNYAAKHQAEHRPEFHKGIVIKTNANQRYATTPLTSALLREVCARSDVPLQDFVVRNDSPCGSTIGPIISSKMGIRTIDVGAPQWAMHSARETCSTSDAAHLAQLCSGFFACFREVDSLAATL